MTPEQFLEYILSLPEEARIQTIDSMRGAMDSGSVSDETYALMAELLSGVNAISAFPEAQGEQRTDADFFDYIMQAANSFGLGPNAALGRKPGDEGFDPHLSMAEALAQQGMPWGLAGVAGTVYDFLEPGLGEWGRAATAVGTAAAALPSRLTKLLHNISGVEHEFIAEMSPAEARYFLRNSLRGHEPEWSEMLSKRDVSEARRMISEAEGVPPEQIYPGGGGLLDWMDDIRRDYGGVDIETLEMFAARDFEGTLRDIKQMYPEAKDWQVAELFSDWITEAYMRGDIPPERYQELVDEVIPRTLGGGNYRTIDVEDALDMARALPEINPRVFRSLGRDSVSEYVAALDRMPPERRAFLTPYSLEQLQEMVDRGYKVRMSDSGAGYILSPEGDLQGVINAGNVKGAGRYAVEDAIREGAVTLDAFDGFLPEYYSQFGFEETGRVKFDRQYAPPSWDYDLLGEPDVVFMRLRGR